MIEICMLKKKYWKWMNAMHRELRALWVDNIELFDSDATRMLSDRSGESKSEEQRIKLQLTLINVVQNLMPCAVHRIYMEKKFSFLFFLEYLPIRPWFFILHRNIISMLIIIIEIFIWFWSLHAILVICDLINTDDAHILM